MKNLELVLQSNLMETRNLPEKTIGIIDQAKNKKLIANLEKQGNKLILFPEPKALLISNETEKFEDITDFDWLIFTDLNSVECFLKILEKNEVNFFELDALRICALGEAIADRLRFEQLHSDVIPPNNMTKSVFSALGDYIFDENEFIGMKFLIIKELNAKSEIAYLLTKKKAIVIELSVYQSVFPDTAQIPKLKALVKGGGIDEFLFTAPEDVFCLAQIFQNEDLRKAFAEIKITAKDEMTRQTLIEHKL